MSDKSCLKVGSPPPKVKCSMGPKFSAKVHILLK